MNGKMNEYVQTLYDQIGRPAFFMMGARRLLFDNQKNSLYWQISGSSVSSVRVTYDIGDDLYTVTFGTETATHPSEVSIEGVEVSELHPTIERMTGFCLAIPRIRFGS